MTLQERRKWKTEKPNLHQGDVVLMKDSQAKRNEWPKVIITQTFPSEDNRDPSQDHPKWRTETVPETRD